MALPLYCEKRGRGLPGSNLRERSHGCHYPFTVNRGAVVCQGVTLERSLGHMDATTPLL